MSYHPGTHPTAVSNCTCKENSISKYDQYTSYVVEIGTILMIYRDFQEIVDEIVDEIVN